MRSFQPQLSYESNSGRYVNLTFGTYKELKKHLADHIASSNSGEVAVHRYRRGEWGEWFEYWTFIKGKLRIDREGWM